MHPNLTQIHHRWFLALFLFCAALVLSNTIHFILFRVLRRKQVESSTLGWGLQLHLGRPARAIFILSCLLAIVPAIPDLPLNLDGLLRQGLIIALVLSLGWFAVGLVYVFQAAAMRRYDLTVENNVQARRVHTQLQLFRRMIIGFIVLIDLRRPPLELRRSPHLALRLRPARLRRRRLPHPRHRRQVHRRQPPCRPPDRLHRTHPHR